MPAHVSASSRDFCTDAQLAHRGRLVELPHPLFGRTTVEGPRYLRDGAGVVVLVLRSENSTGITVGPGQVEVTLPVHGR